MALDLTRQTAIRWNDTDAKYVPLLREGGITAVVSPPNEEFEKACASVGIQVLPAKDMQSIPLDAAAKAKPGGAQVVKAGVWPGVQRPDPSTASATRSLWMDQNCYLVRYIRAVYPNLPPVLGYLPDKDAGVSPDHTLPFKSVELGLVEAWVSGGNHLLALDQRYREGLLKGSAEALAAWRKLGRTANWLRANAPLFGQPNLPFVTVLVDSSENTLEIANLTYRQNVSPALVAAGDPPAPDPARRLVLVAVSIETPQGEVRNRILAHAQAGTTLVVDDPAEKAWWRVPGLKFIRSDPDRDYYSLGKGQVVAYKEQITDPGEFALDVFDFVTQKRRAVRIWNCNAGVVQGTLGPQTGPVRGTAALHIVNYGQPVDLPVLAQIHGAYAKATLLRPESTDALDLKVAKRGTSSEVTLPQLECVAGVVFR